MHEIYQALQKHLDYVINKLRYSPEKQWLISDDRLEGLGYRPRGAAKPMKDAINKTKIAYFINKFSINVDLIKETLDTILEALGARSPLDAALLPPLLTLPEKIILLQSISKSQAFNLYESLKAVAYVWRGFKPRDILGVSKDTANMEFRLRWTYLSALHLSTGSRRKGRARIRLTGIGYAIVHHSSDDPVKIYLDYLRDTTRLGHLVALDIIALETLTGEKFKALWKAYDNLLKKQGFEEYIEQLEIQMRNVIIMQPSDVPNKIMITLAKTVDQLVWELEL